MTKRLRGILIPLVAVACLAVAVQPAMAAPAVTATPGAAPDSYVVKGTGFTPGATVTVFDASACGGETRCPNDYSVGQTTVDSGGSFTVSVQLDPTFQPSAGQTKRALQIAQSDWTPAQLNEAPLVQIPLHHTGTPGAPDTGGGVSPTSGPSSLELAGISLLTLSVMMAAFSAGVTRRQR